MRALIVEDDEGIALGVAEALRADGLQVHHEADGRAGLDAALGGSFDVIVLDLLLPGLNGFRVCAELRAAGDWTPVLVLSSKSGAHDIAEGLHTGADDYLTKPFPMVVLRARIQSLLRRPRTVGTVPFQVDDLRLDPATHRCWRGATEIDLSSREMDVLAHLMARAGQVCSKTHLIENVWGADFGGNPNIVEVYIRHLRRKLDEPFGVTSIETVRGIGYRMRAAS